MPDCKEVHFFDTHFDRGRDWYEDFFPPASKVGLYKAIGEFTPRYIFKGDIAGRIHDTLGPDTKLIVILRNPVERLYSHYKMNVIKSGKTRSFREFADPEREPFQRGLYAQQLERYFERFNRENFLIFIYEELFSSPESEESHLQQLANFLDIEVQGFKKGQASGAVNVSAGIPRFQKLYKSALWAKRKMQNAGMGWITPLANKLGINKTLFGGLKNFPDLSAEDRIWLQESYAPHVRELESLLGRDLGLWQRSVQII